MTFYQTELVAGQYWWVVGEESDILAWGMHEAWLEPILMALVPKDGVFLDVGAHEGHWTVRIGKQKARKVYAVEANVITAHKLLVNCQKNDIGNKVVIIPMAASDGLYQVDMTDPYDQETGGSNKIDGYGGVIPTVPLDSVIPDGDKIDVVKIDVEGHDVEVLNGMVEILRRDKPAIVLEMHGPLYPELNIQPRAEAFLKANDYEYSLLLDHKTPEGKTVCEYWLCQPKE